MVNIQREEIVKVDGKEVKAYRIPFDVNGNPRFVFHFSDIGMKLIDYQNANLLGLKKFTANWFAGGYVIKSYDLEGDMQFYADEVKRIYK